MPVFSYWFMILLVPAVDGSLTMQSQGNGTGTQ
jgi:hypothetical protein